MHEMMYYGKCRSINNDVFLPGTNGQKYMRCDCGCNIFRKIENKPKSRYRCSSCFATYSAYDDERAKLCLNE